MSLPTEFCIINGVRNENGGPKIVNFTFSLSDSEARVSVLNSTSDLFVDKMLFTIAGYVRNFFFHILANAHINYRWIRWTGKDGFVSKLTVFGNKEFLKQEPSIENVSYEPNKPFRIFAKYVLKEDLYIDGGDQSLAQIPEHERGLVKAFWMTPYTQAFLGEDPQGTEISVVLTKIEKTSTKTISEKDVPVEKLQDYFKKPDPKGKTDPVEKKQDPPSQKKPTGGVQVMPNTRSQLISQKIASKTEPNGSPPPPVYHKKAFPPNQPAREQKTNQQRTNSPRSAASSVSRTKPSNTSINPNPSYMRSTHTSKDKQQPSRGAPKPNRPANKNPNTSRPNK